MGNNNLSSQWRSITRFQPADDIVVCHFLFLCQKYIKTMITIIFQRKEPNGNY
jgi:hypothetical protein